MSHAPYSPSGASRWTVCTSSVPLAASAKALGLEAPDSEYARQGTIAMAVAERYLKAMQRRATALLQDPTGAPPPPTIPGAVVEAVGDDAFDMMEWEPEMAPAIQFFLSRAEMLVKHAADPDAWGAETNVHIHQVPTAGTADFHVLLMTGKLVVVDYKHGVGIKVKAEDNPQLLLYAAGLADLYDLDDNAALDLAVCQPRHPEGGWETWATTVRYAREFAEHCAKVISGPPSYVTGPHCRFCPAVLICGKRFQELEEVAAADRVAGDLVARVLDLGPRVNEAVKEARSVAVARLMGGKAIPGWTLKEGRGAYVWKEGAEAEARKRFGAAAFTTPELLSPAVFRETFPAEKDFDAKFVFRRPGLPQLTEGKSEARVIQWPKGAK